MARPAILCGLTFGTSQDWDGWDFTEQYIDFKPNPGFPMPACSILEINTEEGTWEAYDEDNVVFARGRLYVTFSRDTD